MSDVDAVRFLASEHDLEFVNLDTYNVDRAAADALPMAVARRHHVVAVKKKFGTPVIAIANPNDVFALDTLRASLGRDFISVVAAPEQIGRYLDKVYGDEGEEAPAAELPPEPLVVAEPFHVDDLDDVEELDDSFGMSLYGSAFAPVADEPAVDESAADGAGVATAAANGAVVYDEIDVASPDVGAQAYEAPAEDVLAEPVTPEVDEALLSTVEAPESGGISGEAAEYLADISSGSGGNGSSAPVVDEPAGEVGDPSLFGGGGDGGVRRGCRHGGRCRGSRVRRPTSRFPPIEGPIPPVEAVVEEEAPAPAEDEVVATIWHRNPPPSRSADEASAEAPAAVEAEFEVPGRRARPDGRACRRTPCRRAPFDAVQRDHSPTGGAGARAGGGCRNARPGAVGARPSTFADFTPAEQLPAVERYEHLSVTTPSSVASRRRRKRSRRARTRSPGWRSSPRSTTPPVEDDQGVATADLVDEAVATYEEQHAEDISPDLLLDDGMLAHSPNWPRS